VLRRAARLISAGVCCLWLLAACGGAPSRTLLLPEGFEVIARGEGGANGDINKYSAPDKYLLVRIPSVMTPADAQERIVRLYQEEDWRVHPSEVRSIEWWSFALDAPNLDETVLLGTYENFRAGQDPLAGTSAGNFERAARTPRDQYLVVGQFPR
jgi:hypothetical protein